MLPNHSSFIPHLSSQFESAMQQVGGFELRPTLAVAVSGGADSMALLALAQAWVAKHQGKVVALTVDHGLRPESAQEAEFVKRYAASKHIEHHTLGITLEDKSSNIQAKARQLRYQALENFCADRCMLHLLTAHHLNDNIETLAMRSERSEYLDARLGIPFIRYSKKLRIIRPLLAAEKSELIHWLNAEQVPWMEDPSNAKDIYERNRVRKELTEKPAENTKYLQLISDAVKEKRALEETYAEQMVDCLRAHDAGYLSLNNNGFKSLPTALKISLLQRICYACGKEGAAPRGNELITLIAQLEVEKPKGCCLAGLQFTPQKDGMWLITRELAHAEPPIHLKSNHAFAWDGRFIIKCNALPDGYTLGALGEEGALMLKQAKQTMPHTLPRPALLALPAIWHLETLVFVPHINVSIDAGLAGKIIVKQWFRQPLMGSPHRYIV